LLKASSHCPTYADVTSVPAPERQNPRRSSQSKHQRPPPLVRQRDRKINFVDNLVGKLRKAWSVPNPSDNLPQTLPHKWWKSSGLYPSSHARVRPVAAACCRFAPTLKRLCEGRGRATRPFKSPSTTWS
jgi:hypothetical protein